VTTQVPPAGAQTERSDVVVRERPVPHPTPRDYVRIGVALALVTLLEVVLYYIPGLPNAVLVGSLIILMVIKFALVVLWFMHLKFERRMYMGLFATGLAIALFVFSVAFAFAFGA
jgi:cytochrome c oxidase subunit IV